MYDETEKLIKKGVLQGASGLGSIWIEEVGTFCSYAFQDAVNIANARGWIKKGKWAG
jgi:hypothetical protein